MTIYVYTLKWCMAKSGWVLFVIKSILPWYIFHWTATLLKWTIYAFKYSSDKINFPILRFSGKMQQHTARQKKVSLNSTRQMHRSRQVYDWFSIEKLIYNVTEKNFRGKNIFLSFNLTFFIYFRFTWFQLEFISLNQQTWFDTINHKRHSLLQMKKNRVEYLYLNISSYNTLFLVHIKYHNV